MPKYTDPKTIAFNKYVQETYPALTKIVGEIDAMAFRVNHPYDDELLRIIGELAQAIETTGREKDGRGEA